MDEAQIRAVAEPIVAKHRAQILALVGSADQVGTDENLRKIARFVHPLLPLHLRLFLGRDRLAGMLIENRDAVVPFLRSKLA